MITIWKQVEYLIVLGCLRSSSYVHYSESSFHGRKHQEVIHLLVGFESFHNSYRLEFPKAETNGFADGVMRCPIQNR